MQLLLNKRIPVIDIITNTYHTSRIQLIGYKKKKKSYHRSKALNKDFQLNFDDDESIIMIMVIITVIILTVIWSFYQLIYGNLLKKINRNYRELKKLDNDL